MRVLFDEFEYQFERLQIEMWCTVDECLAMTWPMTLMRDGYEQALQMLKDVEMRQYEAEQAAMEREKEARLQAWRAFDIEEGHSFKGRWEDQQIDETPEQQDQYIPNSNIPISNANTDWV
ncbi:hypothetical protein EMMF5_006623 [Cystobasidiomycetes sp. EMM_F5]